MAKKEVTIESLQADNLKLKKQIENQKKYAKQLRNQIADLKLKVKTSGGRGGVYGHELK